MAAALRRAFETFGEDPDLSGAEQLLALGIAPRDADAVIQRLYELYADDRGCHPVREALEAAQRAGDDGKDPDAEPLLAALVALPEGQRATFMAIVDMACALAAADGMALGALYVANEMNGRRARARNAPRR
jgi:hypothetical protein